jgi:hypothetical protein
MAVKTYEQQLEEVQTAIAAVETRGQYYSIGSSRTYRRADLDVLYRREERLRKIVDRVARGGVRVQYGTPVT